jgi:NAD(P)-dependent dehydrogenase (short-subunit alcohol dehydrogenase family)
MYISDCIFRVKFVHCDVTNWNDQVNLFRTAASMTPSNTVDHVVANAGIATEDEVFSYEGIHPSSPGTINHSHSH